MARVLLRARGAASCERVERQKGVEPEEVDGYEWLFKGIKDRAGRNVAREGDDGRTGEPVGERLNSGAILLGE